MSKITTSASALLDGLKRLYDVLSDFEPELERIEIDHQNTEATLIFGVEVPDSFFNRAGNTINLERPLNFTLEEILSEDLLHSYDIAQTSDTEYQIPVKELDPSEQYKLKITGTPSRTALDNLFKQDQYKGRVSRSKYEYNVVYSCGFITWDSDPVVTVITNYRDTIDFDENYLPRKVREALPSSISEYQSDAWTTPYNPEGGDKGSSIDRKGLPDEVQKILTVPADERDWWFSGEVMSDFITTEGPINYFDHANTNQESPIPRSFTVILRSEFAEGQGLTEGTVVFQKKNFWEEVENELLQKS